MTNDTVYGLTHEPLPIECIILAGGMGTRLREAVPDVPKCMAPVNGKPFLQYLIDDLLGQGVSRFIFSLGYLHEIVENFISQQYPGLDRLYVVEPGPLGTGGAVKLACAHTLHEDVLVLNGDTMFRVNVKALLQTHRELQAGCTISLKPMEIFDRYGVVEVDKKNTVLSFQEKRYYISGLINGGVYALNVPYFEQHSPDGIFSFEKDFLEKTCHTSAIKAYREDAYFIDIGIPADYHQAATDFATLF